MDEAVIYGTKGKIVLENCFGPMKAELYEGRDKKVAKFEERVPNGFIYQARHCASLFSEGKVQSDLIPWAGYHRLRGCIRYPAQTMGIDLTGSD